MTGEVCPDWAVMTLKDDRTNQKRCFGVNKPYEILFELLFTVLQRTK